MLIDTHCHLDFPQLADRIPELIAEAADLDVSGMLTIGCDLQTSRRAVQIAEQYPGVVRAAVGIHPNEVAQAKEQDLAQLSALSRSANVVAIGETGLDFYRDRSPRQLQRHWFQQQWELAGEKELPVILHCREAMAEMLDLLRQWCGRSGAKDNERGVMHCFSGNADDALKCLELGLLIGVGGPVTYPKSDPLKEAVRATPLSKLLVETDAPFLAPQKKRGRTNLPGYVRYTAEFVAELKGVSLEELARATSANAVRLFHLDRS